VIDPSPPDEGSRLNVKGAAFELSDEIVAWIETVAAGRVTACDRKPGGARKEAWFVDVQQADGSTAELFLRYDRTDPSVTADPWTLHREAGIYLALQDTEVPVPRVVGVHATHQAMLSERLIGENWFSRIADVDERVATARHFIELLATLHRIDPASLHLPDFPAPTRVPDLVQNELDEWDRVIAARGGDPDPALAFTLRWLRANIPDYGGPVVLVQGDTGPGNFMYSGGRVIAIVDWELAHFGDPMDDIAWLSLRATQEPFPDLPARLHEYAALSGHPIDEARVRYYRVMAEAKLQVMVHRPGGAESRFASSEGGGGDVGNGLIYGMLHRRLWFEALAAAVGLELAPPEVPPSRTSNDHEWLYDVLLTQLREVVVPRIADPLAKQRSKGFARVLKYLAQIDAYGEFYENCELGDATELLGARPASVAVARIELADAARAGRISDARYLRYLARRVARDTELMRPAMGALADRHWPELS
jgi:aminoglycoside phosphotransferase (APT) family kinase protein